MDIFDCDGDGAKDIVVSSRAGVALYRSGQGKSTRTRSFAEPDVDALFAIPGMTQFRSLGPCNDSTRRYEMLGIVAHDSVFGFSGGPHGPGLHPQAFYGRYSHITEITPLGDANGDGWIDFFALGDLKGATILHPTLVLFVGGSYIPIESIGLGVDRMEMAGGHDAVTTWPVPATDIIHVTWDVTLRRRPERFSISDIMGRMVATGSVESWRTSIGWDCASSPAGVYIVRLFDADGTVIATRSIIKQ